MPTLADVALSVATQLGRSNAAGTAIIALEDEIKAEIGETIRYYNRRPWHLLETRMLRLFTVAGQVWYDVVYPDQSEGEEDNTGRATVPVSDLVSVDYMRETASSITDGLHEFRYREFEQLYEGSVEGGFPYAYARYAGRIGIYPEPDQVYTIEISAITKPQIPSADTDESVWFDAAREMIEAGACARMLLKYLRDPARAAEYAQIENGAAAMLQSEHVRKTSTGRLKGYA